MYAAGMLGRCLVRGLMCVREFRALWVIVRDFLIVIIKCINVYII